MGERTVAGGVGEGGWEGEGECGGGGVDVERAAGQWGEEGSSERRRPEWVAGRRRERGLSVSRSRVRPAVVRWMGEDSLGREESAAAGICWARWEGENGS